MSNGDEHPQHATRDPSNTAEIVRRGRELSTTVRAAGIRIPVVIVPGILGTRLEDQRSGELAWNPLGRLPTVPPAWLLPILAASPPLAAAYYGVGNLYFGSDPGDFASNTEQLRNGDLRPASDVPDDAEEWQRNTRNYYNLVSKCYGDLVEWLYESPDFKPYVCGYDWRQSNHLSAYRLRAVVDQALHETQQTRCIIIAHSMGGLVTRYYCRRIGGHGKVAAAFFYGSPFNGAPLAYKRIKLGIDPLSGFEDFGMFLFLDGEPREVGSHWASMFQLLPGVQNGANRSDEESSSWLTWDTTVARSVAPGGELWDAYENERPPPHYGTSVWNHSDPDAFKDRCREHLTLARRVDRVMRQFHHRNTFLVYKNSTDTAAHYHLENRMTRGGQIVFNTEEDYPGDQTVPAWSANARGHRISDPWPNFDDHIGVPEVPADEEPYLNRARYHRARVDHADIMTDRETYDHFVAPKMELVLQELILGGLNVNRWDLSPPETPRGYFVQPYACSIANQDHKVFQLRDDLTEAVDGQSAMLTVEQRRKIYGRSDEDVNDLFACDREAYASIIAAREENMYAVYLGCEAEYTQWGRYGSGEPNVDVVAVRTDGKWFLADGKGNLGDQQEWDHLLSQMRAAIRVFGGTRWVYKLLVVCRPATFSSGDFTLVDQDTTGIGRLHLEGDPVEVEEVPLYAVAMADRRAGRERPA